MDFNEIEEYFNLKWKNAFNKKAEKPYEEEAEIILEKNIDFYFSMKQEKRENDFLKLKIVDSYLFFEINEMIRKHWILKNPLKFTSQYDNFVRVNQENYFLQFFKLCDNAIYSEDCVFKKFEDLNDKMKNFDKENTDDFIEFKATQILEKFHSFSFEILKKKCESIVNQKEKYLVLFQPFEKLREFCNKISII